ncbi:MAG: hypothetical protein ACJAXA_003197 [Candidatus Aldehydirespiratoraceae bacterium]|jgi:hypothetical protein
MCQALTMAEIESIADASKGLEACGDLFRADPIGCSPVTVTLYPGRSSKLLRVTHGSDTIGAAVAEENGWTLAPLGEGAAEVIADELPIDRRLQLTGRPGDVAAIAGRWSDRCDGAIDTGDLFRWYRLGELNEPKKRKGELAVASRDRIDEAVTWLQAYGDDVGLPIAADVAATRVSDAVNEGRLMEWRLGDDIVSQLIVSPVRLAVVRLNAVYTPVALRKDGYSSAIVAAVAAQQIARQKVDHVVFDQPAFNGATNRMYRRLGFESVSESLVVWLTPKLR